MSGRIENPEPAVLIGGALVMLGASLPWLTLFAGLQQYSGMIGSHGQILFAGGALAVVTGAITMSRRARGWIRWASGILGLLLLGFTGWLGAGLVETLHRGVSAMLVPRAGPGLFVSGVGAALVAAAPLLMSVRARRQAREPSCGIDERTLAGRGGGK